LIEINIRSNRGEGATTVAVAVARHLRGLGFKVAYKGRNVRTTADVCSQIDNTAGVEITRVAEVEIYDVGAQAATARIAEQRKVNP